MLIHRNPPTKDEFILLKAGQWISATVQINDAFTLSDDGLYAVEYVKPLMVTPRDEMSMMTEVNVNEVIYIDLEGARHLSRPVKEEEDTPDFTVNIESCSSASFTGGTSSQRDDILKGHKELCKEFSDTKGNVTNNNYVLLMIARVYTVKVMAILLKKVSWLTNGLML